MKKRRKIINASILILIFLILGVFAISFIPTPTGHIVKQQEQEVKFYFYDSQTNCPLNGYVFIENKVIGKSINGIFNLTYSNYLENFQNKTQIEIFGRLGDCFNSELFFNKYFIIPKIEKYHFLGESKFDFKTEINKNNPSKKELQGFIQPPPIKPELDNINLNQNTQNPLEDLSKINNYLNNQIKYIKDWKFNQSTNNWQTPTQTLEIKTGDCEDYSTSLLSLFLAYNNSLNCYNIVFTSHVTTICDYNNNYVYYDQQRTELKQKIYKNNYNKAISDLKNLKQDYFEYYGIENNSTPHYAFNDKEFIEFNNEKEFLDWQYNLNGKQEQNIFNKYEQELKQNTESLEIIELNQELRTQTISLPSLKKFPYIPLIIGGLMIIILIIILIKIKNKFSS